MITEDELIGSWSLESWTIGYSDRDDFTNPYGEDPRGLLIYSNDGWMNATICRSERDPLPEDVPFRKLPDGVKAQAFSSYFQYAGRFRVVEGDVIHYVTTALNPNMVGELDGHTLVLSGKDEAGGVTRFHSLVWHRIPPVSP
jgi:hypothetical protein